VTISVTIMRAYSRIGRYSEGALARANFRLSYRGTRPEPLLWVELEELIRGTWGAAVDSLPHFPDVLGGVWARWVDGNDVEYRADNLTELRTAYERGETKWISMSGRLGDGPEAFLRYGPASRARPWTAQRAVLSAIVEASEEAVADQLLKPLELAFPNVETTLFVAWAGQDEDLAEWVARLLRSRVPSHVNVFRAPRDLESGAEPASSIDHALASSSLLVALCSWESKSRHWIAWEAATVRAHGGRIVPLLINVDATEFSGPIIAYVQARKGWDRDEFEEAMRDAVTECGGEWRPLEDDEWSEVELHVSRPESEDGAMEARRTASSEV
jgi:TIR domain-containing protein